MDNHVFRWVNHLAHRTPWLHGVATTYAVWGIALSALLLVAAWWDARSADDAPPAVAGVVWAAAAALSAVAYHAGSLMALGCTPAVWTIETYLANRHPSEQRGGAPRFLRLLRGSERAKA